MVNNDKEELEIIDEGFSDWDGNYKNSLGNICNAFEEIEKAEKEIEEKKLAKQTANVHFRWFDFEIERCKKLAEKKGLKYHSYLKSIIKQAKDKDERELLT